MKLPRLPDVSKELTAFIFLVMCPWIRRLYFPSIRRGDITQPCNINTQKSECLGNHTVVTSNHSIHIVKNIFISDYFIFFFIVSVCFMIHFLRNNKTTNVFVIYGRQSPRMHNKYYLKIRKKKGIFSQYYMFLVIMLRICLFSQQELGLAVHVPHDSWDRIVFYCYCLFLQYSFLFSILKQSYSFQVGIGQKCFCHERILRCQFFSKWMPK
jgi:hypothetical protein